MPVRINVSIGRLGCECRRYYSSVRPQFCGLTSLSKLMMYFETERCERELPKISHRHYFETPFTFNSPVKQCADRKGENTSCLCSLVCEVKMQILSQLNPSGLKTKNSVFPKRIVEQTEQLALTWGRTHGPHNTSCATFRSTFASLCQHNRRCCCCKMSKNCLFQSFLLWGFISCWVNFGGLLFVG